MANSYAVYEKMMDFIDNEDTKGLEAYLKKGNDPNATNSEDETILYYAIANSFDAVKILVENGADVNHSTEDAYSPLQYESINASFETITYLLDNGADFEFRDGGLLHCSFDQLDDDEKIQLIDILVEKGLDLDLENEEEGKTAIWNVVTEPKVLKHYIDLGVNCGPDIVNRDEGNTTLLHEIACFAGTEDFKEILKLIIASYDDIDVQDDYGNTPLLMAVGRNRHVAAEFLIENGANVNAQHHNGVNILGCSESKKMVELILSNGCEADISTSFGSKALYNAANNINWEPDFLEFLLENGVNINAQDEDGNTALFQCNSRYEMETAVLLLDHGADPTIKNIDGKTIIDIVKEREEDEMYALFTSKGETKPNIPSEVEEAGVLGEEEFKHKVISININKMFDEGKMSLYESVRKYWKLSPSRANQADYILAEFGGKIRAVFKTDEKGWQASDEHKGRYFFEGVEVFDKRITKRYVGKKVVKQRGQANPVRYWYK